MKAEGEFEFSPVCNPNQTDLFTEKRGFMINVSNIENITVPKNIIIKLDFCGKNLNSSEVIAFESSETKTQYEFFYEISDVSEYVIKDFSANPFVFSVWLEDTSVSTTNSLAVDNEGKKKENLTKTKGSSKKGGLNKENSSLRMSMKERPKSRESRSESSKRQQSTEIFPAVFKPLGVANLDVIPMLLGQSYLREVLLIHATMNQTGSQATAWTNLPRLHVSVTGKGGITNTLQESVNNILHFTIETLHNITPDFKENVQVGTVLPKSQGFEVIKFTNSTLVTDNLTWFSKRKKWCSLSNVQGQGALSSYKLSENFIELINTMDYDLSRQSLESVPRIQWYQLHRSFLSAEAQQVFKQKLVKYRCWPVEVYISSSTTNQPESSVLSPSVTSPKSGKKSPKESPKKRDIKNNTSEPERKLGHFVTFLDLSKLLYPGVSSVRVAAQLYTFTEGGLKEKFGSDIYIYDSLPSPSINSKVEKVIKSVASKKDQSGASTTVSSKKGKTTATVETIEDEPSFIPDPEPVCDDFGNPIFIVVQVELLKPLIPKKTPEKVVACIESIVPARPLPTKEAQTKINSTLAFELCMEDLAQVIHNEYQRFYTNNEKSTNDLSCKNFLMHLHMTGAYSKMKESVKESVETYVHEGLGLPKRLSIINLDNQSTVAEVYSALIDKMCTVINNLAGYNVEECDPHVTCDDLLYFAVESMEEGTLDKAQEYLLQRLENTKRADPQCWLDYAMFWVKKMEYEIAGECAREAISLDSKFTLALFFYGLLSWLTEDFDVAEQFLLAVVAFDPHFLEGWVALHMFHKQMNDQLDAVVELLNAKTCIEEGFPLLNSKLEPTLAWCPQMVDNNRVYLLTAIHMIQLSFPELAELALSYDLLLYGKSVNYLYYLAVCHYKQGRFADSISHLEEALRIVWEDDRVWALKGHSLYKLQLMNEAKEAFEFVLNCDETHYDLHLVNLRLGNILKREGNHKEAHNYYTNICKLSPTPLSWLGLGITNFMDDEMKDAELALSEANMLDARMSLVWGYLALVNLMMARPSIFNQCMNQALRFGLDDPVLLERLNILEQFVKPTNC